MAAVTIIEGSIKEMPKEIKDFLEQRAAILLTGPTFTKKDTAAQIAAREAVAAVLAHLDSVRIRVTE